MALWDAGSTDDLLAALPLLDDARRPGGRRPVPRPAARGGREQRPPGPVPATRANPAGLTARQLDVLALLADGLSNADIAARLVISPKTADHHVSAILAKLDVRTRGEAAAVARRLGRRGSGPRPAVRARTAGHAVPRAAAAAFAGRPREAGTGGHHDVPGRQRHPGRRPQPAAGPEPAGREPLEIALDLGRPAGVDRHGQHRRRTGEPDGVLHRHRPAAGPQFRGRRGAVAGQDDPVLHRVAGEPPVGDDAQVHAEATPTA